MRDCNPRRSPDCLSLPGHHRTDVISQRSHAVCAPFAKAFGNVREGCRREGIHHLCWSSTNLTWRPQTQFEKSSQGNVRHDCILIPKTARSISAFFCSRLRLNHDTGALPNELFTLPVTVCKLSVAGIGGIPWSVSFGRRALSV